ncbi:hypothetical protein GIB67_022551 [Kingdonia uniflora]|uniref:Uncharacterized protein n=1 Tax=Kingdonia uniflora TaxID=39325 RepID=A0A7J7L7B3_9MAGN|nr:hypothetical protein GIB67_022551 [Kingdonia uniflora]
MENNYTSLVFHEEDYEQQSGDDDDDNDDDGEGVPFDGLHDMFEDLQALMHNDNLARRVEDGESEDMAPGTTSQRLRAQSTSQLAVNTGNDSSIAIYKRKRGKVVNNKVIDYKAITGKKPRIEIHPKYDKFDIDMHLPHVNGLAQEKWDACCDWFGREEFKRNSKTQQPIGMIELYRQTQSISMGWTSLIAEENYDILSRFSKGLGHGVLPQSSKRVSSIQLEEEVQCRRDEEEMDAE